MRLIPKVYYFYKLTKKIFVKKLLVVLTLLFVIVHPAFTPADQGPRVDTNAKIKAVFIYNFTKYIQWPADYQTGDFTIAILGDNASLYKDLVNMSKVKKVGNQNLNIKLIADASQIGKAHIVYIPQNNNALVGNTLSAVKGKSTLVVTESPGYASRGATINFTITGGQQKFELNKLTAQRHNLKVSSTLESKAVLVN